MHYLGFMLLLGICVFVYLVGELWAVLIRREYKKALEDRERFADFTGETTTPEQRKEEVREEMRFKYRTHKISHLLED